MNTVTLVCRWRVSILEAQNLVPHSWLAILPSPTFYTDKKITSLSSLTKLSHCHLTGTEFSNSRQANQKIIVRITRPLLEKKALKFGMVIVLERYYQNLKERKVTFWSQSFFNTLNLLTVFINIIYCKTPADSFVSLQ